MVADRAADVVLKERRPLVLCVRETPFHLGPSAAAGSGGGAGAVICRRFPALPSSAKPDDDVINQTVNRVIDQFDIPAARSFYPLAGTVERTSALYELLAFLQCNFVAAIKSSTFNLFFCAQALRFRP
jgi:4-hydroxy-3-polyprenylbenzoate decarboxylase